MSDVNARDRDMVEIHHGLPAARDKGEFFTPKPKQAYAEEHRSDHGLEDSEQSANCKDVTLIGAEGHAKEKL